MNDSAMISRKTLGEALRGMKSAVDAIALSAGVAGLLDIVAAGIQRRAQGMRFRALLQFVASGALGNRAFEGGSSTAWLGLFFHFVFATLWAGIYFIASQSMQGMLERPWLWGALYGVIVHIIMSRVVVPISRTAKRSFSWTAWLTQLVIHIACVGIPIAVVQAWLVR
jgi:hypothetical protein